MEGGAQISFSLGLVPRWVAVHGPGVGTLQREAIRREREKLVAKPWLRHCRKEELPGDRGDLVARPDHTWVDA